MPLLYEPGDLERHAENRNSLDYVETYLAEHDNHIVIKPNNGARGINVFQIITPDQIPPVLKKIFSSKLFSKYVSVFMIYCANLG